jgi:CheY-like chemotaxis protein
MAKPVILCVDDEPAVAAAVQRDLRARFQEDYRVLSSTSGADALETLSELKRRDSPVALFVVDQRMPGMSGTEFLERAMELYPDAKKVLLTAYADTDAAIAGHQHHRCSTHYLMKPWDPPEEMLYPILDDLLDDWQAAAPLPYEGIRVVGTAVVGDGATTSRSSSSATASRTAGSTSSGRRRGGGPRRARPRPDVQPARWCFPTASGPARTLEVAEGSASTPGQAARSTTSSSSAPVPPVSPPRSTGPPRACGPWSSRATRRAARRARRRASRTTSASPRACRAPTSPSGPSPGDAGSAPRS